MAKDILKALALLFFVSSFAFAIPNFSTANDCVGLVSSIETLGEFSFEFSVDEIRSEDEVPILLNLLRLACAPWRGETLSCSITTAGLVCVPSARIVRVSAEGVRLVLPGLLRGELGSMLLLGGVAEVGGVSFLSALLAWSEANIIGPSTLPFMGAALA